MAAPNITLPKITMEELQDDEKLQKILSYLYQLNEQLRYELTHIDDDNISGEGISEKSLTDSVARTLTNDQGEVLKLYANARRMILELSGKVDASTEDLSDISERILRVEANSERIETEISYVQETVEAAQGTADAALGAAGDNAADIKTLTEKVTRVEQTADGLSVEVSEKVTQQQVDEAIDAIDEFHNTAVDITAYGMNISTTGSIRAFVDEQEELTIDEKGVSGRVIVAKERLDAPNAVLKNLSSAIAWKGSIQASLDAAPKWLTQYTELAVPPGTYQEDIVIRGFRGARLAVSLLTGVTINGAITIEHCDDVLISSSTLGQAKIFPRAAYNAITAKSVGFLELQNLQLSGYRGRTGASDGSSSCIGITGGTTFIGNCCVEYSNDYAILFYLGATGYVQDCIGGVQGGGYTTGANMGVGVHGSGGAHFSVFGKCPVAVTNIGGWVSTVLTDGLVPTEGGMEYVAPAEITRSFPISKHCTYFWGVQRRRDDQSDQFSQGHYGGYTTDKLNWRTGAMWFASAAAELAGKTVVSATLRLRRAGGGSNQTAIPVYLGWMPLAEADFTSTLRPDFTESTDNYPGAGLQREEEGVYDVTQLMDAVKAGYAIAVREPTKSYGTDSRDSSPAYTNFYGKGSSYEPVLTVTYR